MTTLRQFTCDDLFRFNPVNLDPLTETYGVQFYLQYLARWPEYFLVAESPSNEIMGMIYQWFFSATYYHHTTYVLLWSMVSSQTCKRLELCNVLNYNGCYFELHHFHVTNFLKKENPAGCLPQSDWWKFAFSEAQFFLSNYIVQFFHQPLCF